MSGPADGGGFRLTADYVVPGDGAGTLWARGAVDVGADGRIVAAGPLHELGEPPGPIHPVGGLLMPGLVNAHAHTPMTLVRSAGDGLPLQRWLTEGVWPREGRMTPDDASWGMTLGAVEMLLSGVTTTSELYLYEEQLIEAARASGMRLVMAAGIVAALSPDGDIGGRIDQVDACHDAHHDPAAGVSVAYGPHSVYDLTPEQVAEIGERARARDALVHIHLEETEAEREQVLAAHGKTATQMLADAGVLDGPVLVAHAVWIDDTDRRLLGEAHAGVAHCPVSNLKLGSGIARIPELLAAGAVVGVGTDGPASNDNLNLWDELRLAPLLARGTNHDAEAMGAVQGLDLATRSGARATGLDDVGELRSGAHADIVRIDLDRPELTPGRAEELLAHLVWAGNRHLVTDVWVGGRRVVEAGTCLTVDVDRAVAEARARGARLAG